VKFIMWFIDLKDAFLIGHWMSANRLKLNADKSELIWTGSRYNLSLLGSSGPSLQVGVNEIKPSDYVRLLGVTIVQGWIIHEASEAETSGPGPR